MIDIVGYAAAILGTIAWLPQVLKAWKTRETKDLSYGTNFMILACMLLWGIYGIALASWPMIVGNMISIALVTSILIAKYRFD